MKKVDYLIEKQDDVPQTKKYATQTNDHLSESRDCIAEAKSYLAEKQDYMAKCLRLANKAFKKKEVPVGCVIVKNNKIIARGYNKKESKQNALYHAEMIAINKACKKLKSWRLDNCQLFVNLEPCAMCAGAIISARIDNVVFALADSKNHNTNLYEKNNLNYTVNVTHDKTYELESKKLLHSFFHTLRKN